MKTRKKLIILLSIGIALYSCETDKKSDSIYEKLKGTWINNESFSLSFIDFFSSHTARFGDYSMGFKHFDTFEYSLFDNKIAIRFFEDDTETIHDLIFHGSDTIEISDMTIIPENPNIVFYRKGICTDKIKDTITLGVGEVYYDFDNFFRLEIDSVVNDSRCPSDVICDWGGDAEVRFNLIMEGNYQYIFSLHTNIDFQHDTLFRGINFALLNLTPYPAVYKPINYNNYQVKIVATKE